MRRALPAIHLLLTAILIAGSFDLHPHRDHSVPVDPEVPVYTGAAHPHQAPHAEDAGQAVIVRCPACLLPLHSQASPEGDAPGAVLFSPSGSTRPDGPANAVGAVRLSGGSRAPPSD